MTNAKYLRRTRALSRFSLTPSKDTKYRCSTDGSLGSWLEVKMAERGALATLIADYRAGNQRARNGRSNPHRSHALS